MINLELKNIDAIVPEDAYEISKKDFRNVIKDFIKKIKSMNKKEAENFILKNKRLAILSRLETSHFEEFFKFLHNIEKNENIKGKTVIQLIEKLIEKVDDKTFLKYVNQEYFKKLKDVDEIFKED